MIYEHTIVRLRQLEGKGKALRDNPYASEDAVDAWEFSVLSQLEERPVQLNLLIAAALLVSHHRGGDRGLPRAQARSDALKR